MSHAPVMADLALQLTQQHVLSARPDAPVVAPRRRRRRRFSAPETETQRTRS